MVLDERRASILKLFFETESPIPTSSLEKKLGVSQRTIYYDIQQINNWLEQQGIESIKRKHGAGFYLTEEARTKLPHQAQWSDEWGYQYSQEERRILLMIYLLTAKGPSSMKMFIELVHASRGTIVKDLKQIKKHFAKHSIQLDYQPNKGYVITGQETAKREILSDLVAEVYVKQEAEVLKEQVHHLLLSHGESADQDTELQERIKNHLYEMEELLHLTFTEETVELLSIQILITLKRLDTAPSLKVDEEEKEVLRTTKAFQVAKEMIEKLHAKDTSSIPEDEICFIAMNILGAKVHRDDFSSDSEKELEGLRNVVKRMINDFQAHACIIFDDREGLEDNLIAHIKPTYYRLKYGVKIANELAESIQENYSELIHLTRKVMIHLEYFVGVEIPEEEIAYIALHFGGWLKREKKHVPADHQAIIVCENGIGTSNMLKSQLENLLSGIKITQTCSMREFESQKDALDVDIIFSTNFIKEKDIPVIHVPAILSNTDKEFVMQELNKHLSYQGKQRNKAEKLIAIIERHATIHDRDRLLQDLEGYAPKNSSAGKERHSPVLQELLTSDTIQFKDKASDWMQAIKIAAQPLVDKNFIHASYVDAMIENVNEFGPYIVIAPKIAIPHARPEAGVERLGMSLLKLEEPVGFSEQEKHQANLVIVLAAIDNETHLKALSQLTTMLSEDGNIDKILNSQDKNEITDLIETYSH
ncbi:BglG family transcription antiterminator [Thalassobacillus devorans]|uniref:BglG family transcription antiterminator n=1 Tax=Thalassobacillus devorans TaxID=279813 RepID=UPI000A1CACB1|nr:BglG family transcription antiterminator [Thalassobacillus devorans]